MPLRVLPPSSPLREANDNHYKQKTELLQLIINKQRIPAGVRIPKKSAIAILNENGTEGRRGTAPVLGSGEFLFVNQVGLL